MSNIFKYRDFINEGIIFYDPTFLEVLEKIKDNPSVDSSSQKIANKLFFMEGEEIDKMDIGAVGFSDNPKTLKFKSFKKLKDELGEGGIKGAVQSTYSPTGSGSRSTIKNILSKSKDEIKIGRIVKKILTYIDANDFSKDKDNFSDSDIEKFVNTLKTEFKKKDDVFDNFELVSGDDIKKYYLENSYVSSKGTLGSSCMKYTYRNKYMNFYSINSDVVKLLIYKNPNGDGILGRALVWTAIDVDSQDNITFMDRVYTTNDSDVNLFKDYALKNGWIYKDENNSLESFTFKGNHMTLRVNIKEGRYDHYPYLDTLVYYDFVNGILSNDPDNFRYSDHINLESTDGKHYCYECDGEVTAECEVCHSTGGGSCWECDTTGRKECGECYAQGYTDCEECNGSGYLDCPECDGEGCEECFDSGAIDCDKCDGEGGIECEECNGDGDILCDDCDGEGEYPCASCYGEGTTECSVDSCRSHDNMPSVDDL